MPVALNRLLKVLIYDERVCKVTLSRPPNPSRWLGVEISSLHIADSWYTPSSLFMVGMFVLICILSSIHLLNLTFLGLIKMAVRHRNCQHP